MKKMTFNNNLNYIFDPARPLRKYSIDNGETWVNHGDYCEMLAKSVLGFAPIKDANTRFDKGDDIPEIGASVKSWKASLCEVKGYPTNMEDYLNMFWANDHSKVFIWVHDYADMVDLYFMNKAEFQDFVNEFKFWDRTKVRIMTCYNKTCAWLDARCA